MRLPQSSLLNEYDIKIVNLNPARNKQNKKKKGKLFIVRGFSAGLEMGTKRDTNIKGSMLSVLKKW